MYDGQMGENVHHSWFMAIKLLSTLIG